MANFTLGTNLFWGKNGSVEAIKCLKDKGIKTIGFILDLNFKDNNYISMLFDLYASNNMEIKQIYYYEEKFEPNYDYLDKVAAVFRKTKLDLIVAIGGGSVLDLGKAVGILMRNPGIGTDYRGVDTVNVPGIPVVCYPTTAGTGSEVTFTATFIDLSTNIKMGINGKNVTPLFGVLMPELTYSCPKSVTISSGCDAMVHSLEAATSTRVNKISADIGRKGFALAYNNIQRVLDNPEDYEARENMLLASYYSAVAMMISGGGPAHAIAYNLGVHYHIPHGIAGGMFIPGVIKYNIEQGYLGYADVYSVCETIKYESLEKASYEFYNNVKELFNKIGALKPIREYGLTEKDIENVVELTCKNSAANLGFNPVAIDAEGVHKLLMEVY